MGYDGITNLKEVSSCNLGIPELHVTSDCPPAKSNLTVFATSKAIPKVLP